MVRKSLNWRVLIGTFVVGTIVGGALFAVHSWQLTKTAAAMLSDATTLADSDPQKGAKYLERYLKIVPGDGAARVKLAETHFRFADSVRKTQRLTDQDRKELLEWDMGFHYRALATAPEASVRTRLRKTLGDVLLELNRLPQAESLAKQILNENENENDPSGNRLLAFVMYRQFQAGAYAAANRQETGLTKTLEKAQKLNPDDISLAIFLATLYRDHAEFVTAENPGLNDAQCLALADQALEVLIQSRTDRASAFLARSTYRAQYGIPGAKEDLAEAKRLSPGDPRVLHVSALTALEEARRLGNSDKSAAHAAFELARSEFEQLLIPSSEDKQDDRELARLAAQDDAYLGLGDALLGLGETDSAVAKWQEGIAHADFNLLTQQITLQSRIADAYLYAKRGAAANPALQAIDQLISQLDTTISADQRRTLTQLQDYRWGAFYLQMDKPREAIPRLRQVVLSQRQAVTDQDLAVRACTLLAGAYGRMGVWQESAMAFDQAAFFQPQLGGVYLAAANAWLLAGRPTLASERAEQAIAMQPSAPAGGWFLLAAAQLRHQLSQPARERSWTRLEQALAALKPVTNDPTLTAPWRASFLAADYCLIKAKANDDPTRGIPAAIDELRDAETRFASSMEFLNQLSLVYQQLDQPGEADRVVGLMRQLKPDSIDADICTAQLAILRQDFDKAAQTIKGLRESNNPPDPARTRQIRLNLALAKRDLDAARVVLMEDVANNSTDLNALRRLMELDLERGDVDALLDHDRQLQRLFGDAGKPLRHYFNALRWLSSKAATREELQHAIDEQAELARLQPQSAETYTVLGQIELRLNHADQAIVAFERAIQLGESRIQVFEQLISLLQNQKRYTDVETYLSKIDSQTPLSQQLTEIGTAQHLRNDHQGDALKLAREGAAQRPTDPLAHISLGRMLFVSNQAAEAEREFLRAVELAPADDRGWSALLSYYTRTGAIDKARDTLKSMMANVKLADNNEREFVMGQGYEYLGDSDEAARCYEKAAQNSPENPAIQLRLAALCMRSDPAKAEPFLRKAYQLDPSSTNARLLAAYLGSRDNAIDLEDAEKLLGGDATDLEKVPVEDRRLKALLWARYGGEKKAAEAVKFLESIVTSPAAQPGDQLTLAKLYELQTKWIFDSKVAAEKRNAAQHLLVTLAARSNPDLGHLTALIDFLFRHNQMEEAGIWLNSFEQVLEKKTPFSPDGVVQLIQLRIRHGSTDRCDKWLDKLDANEPNSVRPLAIRAQVLSATGKTDQIPPLVEARVPQILAAAADNATKAQIQGAIGDLYSAAKDDARAETWYRQFVASQPERFELIASCVARQGRVGEAIALCTEAAKSNDTAKPARVLATLLVENSAGASELAVAEPTITAALQRFPKDIGLQYSAALIQVLRNRRQEAIDGFSEVVKLNPRHALALNNLAFLLGEKLETCGEALERVDQALEIFGADPGFLDTKGTILLNQKKYAEAIKWLSLAVQGTPPDPRYNFHLALAYYKTNDLNNARQELRKALDQKLETQVLTEEDRRQLKDLRTSLN